MNVYEAAAHPPISPSEVEPANKACRAVMCDACAARLAISFVPIDFYSSYCSFLVLAGRQFAGIAVRRGTEVINPDFLQEI